MSNTNSTGSQPSAANGRRICMLVYSFYESDNRVMRYARALVDRGDEVDVIALSSGDDQPRFEVLDKVNVHRIQRRDRNEKGKFSYLYRLLKFCVNSALCLSRLQLKRKYDLVHVHNVPDFLVFSALLPKLSGARIILDIHDILPEFFANKFRRPDDSFYVGVLRFIEYASAGFADHVIISNHLWRDKITLRSVPADKCTVFINHVDTTVFNCARTRNEGPFIMIYHGGLQRHQGLDLAINAFARIHEQMPRAEFHIYGGGNVKPDLEALVAKLSLTGKVLFFEAMPMRKIAEIVANADLGVVPKRADSFGNEAFSTKIMEYMAEGVPAIVSKTRVDQYYFNDSIVRFFESGNENELAAAMLTLFNNPESRAKLALNAREFVARNSWDVKKHEYLHLVDSLICSPKTRPVPVAQNSIS
ncbi:MAG TPA: glycosyltransferase family 4 protein [Verrucomicrobiae bacterium]|jgi:glycosyltransferase involved in cell wall biosynthesis|nr:glycosyltransferase family 4 protein [Verrucomicrobiae bacterium]